jgi:3-phenylpropionate/cinnamic acid dioxygenase small subunit
MAIAADRDLGPLLAADVHAEVAVFLAQEAELLDTREFRGWLDLVGDDFTYRVPVPVTPDNPAAQAYDAAAYIVDETRETLAEHWFVRFRPDMWEMAWSENPPVRYRHFVTNIRVRATDEPDVLDARSNVIVSAVRQSSPTTSLHAERFDLIMRTSGGMCLRSRFVVIDETVLDFAQLRVVM